MRKALAQHLMLQVLLVVGFVALIGGPSLLYPFGTDQGEHACIAWSALNGKTIYRQVFDVKPPLTYLMHELALVAFGHSMMAIRLLDLLWQCATALIVLFIARRISTHWGAGVLAAALYAIFYYVFDFNNTAQTDGFQGLPVALGVWFFLEARRQERSLAYAGCGMALGIAVLFKYPIGILLPLLALLALPLRGSHVWRRLLPLAAGFCLPILACVAMLAAAGACSDFIAIQLYYIPSYTLGRSGQGGYLLDLLRHLFLFDGSRIGLWLSALALIYQLAGEWRGKSRELLICLGCWWLAAVISLVIQDKPAPYQMLPLLAPQSIILARLPFTSFASRSSRVLRWALVALTELLVVTYVLAIAVRGYPYTPGALLGVALGKQSLEAVYEHPAFAERQTGHAIARQIEAARYLDSHTTPDDTIFVWGFEPGIYFLSQRLGASRFIYNFPLYGDFRWHELRKVCLADLERNKPRYILVVADDAIPWVTGVDLDSTTALAGFDGLTRLLATRYRFERVIGSFTLYRRGAD